MSIVCVDTQILYWSIVKKASRGAENLMPLASDFMKWLETKEHTLIIPSIIVGEMLIPIPEDEKMSVLKQFSEDWIIVEYDLKAATIYAKLRCEHIVKNRLHDIRKLHPDVTKKELVADLMIISTAIANDAEIIYSHNEDLRNMAEGYLLAKNFLDENFQTSMNLSELDK